MIPRSWLRMLVAGLALIALGLAPTAQAQTVTDIRPKSGAPGTSVRIYGTSLSGSTVSIGGELASTISSSSNLLEVEVPSGVSGLSTVSLDAGVTTAADRFTVVTSGSGSFESFANGDGFISNGAVAAADYDVDDTTEVVLSGAVEGSGTATVYTPDGAGGVRTESEGLSGLIQGTVNFGDVNGDGYLDLLLTGSDGFSPQTALYLNDLGTGYPGTEPTSLPNFVNSAAEFGDIDQDGDLDLILAGRNESGEIDTSTVVYTNDGLGNFTATDTLIGVANGTLDLADVNNDDELDLLVTGTDSANTGRAVLYTNTGGTFTKQTNVGDLPAGVDRGRERDA